MNPFTHIMVVYFGVCWLSCYTTKATEAAYYEEGLCDDDNFTC